MDTRVGVAGLDTGGYPGWILGASWAGYRGLAKLATKVGVAGLDTMGASRAGYRGWGVSPARFRGVAGLDTGGKPDSMPAGLRGIAGMDTGD